MGYLNLVDGFVYKDPVFRAKLDALTENDAYLKDNGWNTSTKTLFYQAAVPTGWTKDVTQNNKFLRVVNDTGGGSGGSSAASATITLAHSAHSLTAAPDHTHAIDHVHFLATASVSLSSPGGTLPTIMSVAGRLFKANNSGATSGTKLKWLLDEEAITTGSAGSHNHGGNSTGSALTDIAFAYADIIIGTKDSGGGTYTDLTSEFGSGDIINFDPFVELAENDEYNYTRLMPATSVVVFGQATAPLGWTKLATVNDKALRVVSGTGGGTGGSTSPSAAVTMTHTHSTSSDTGHTHTTPTHSHDMGTIAGSSTSSLVDATANIQADGSGILRTSATSGPTSSQTVYLDETATDGADTTGSNSAHTHTLASSGTNWQLAYVDLIQCSKDSAGAPYSYEDVTSGVFGWKKLVSKQKLNKLAKNDEYVLFHTLEATSKAFFFMASVPITWTKITTQHDKALRVVSGSSGGSSGGGSQLLSVALPLAHTHVISSVAHDHDAGSHTHTLASSSQTVNVYTQSGGGDYLSGQSFGNNFRIDVNPAGATGASVLKKTTAAPTIGTSSDSVSHAHGTTSGSALSDIILAYVDVLYASKD